VAATPDRGPADSSTGSATPSRPRPAIPAPRWAAPVEMPGPIGWIEHGGGIVEIGHVLATCVSLFNPSVIAVGGLVAQSAESLLAGIREVVYGRSLPLATGELQILASRTAGQAGVIGAATMVVQHVLSPEQVELQLAAAAVG